MVYRTPWVDEERLLDDAEIAAFRATLRAQRRWACAVGALVIAGGGAIALVASSSPTTPVIVFERKGECVYDGCFCRGEHGLVQTTCPAPTARACLPIADHCAE